MGKKSRGTRYLLNINRIGLIMVVLSIILSGQMALAVRGNWGVRRVGPLMEGADKHEEAAFYYRAALDFYASILQQWIGNVYDERVDEIYQQYAQPFGEEGWRSAKHEERWDTMAAYLFFSNRDGASRNIEKGHFSSAQRERLEDRIRVYIEDLLDPDHGFGGDFSFSRKAWVLERTGLFWHAAYRRELAGRYAIDVCSRYYAAIADEMERVFADPARANLYRKKAEWWRTRGLTEFQLCNADRALAALKGDEPLKRLNREQVIAVLKKGLGNDNLDSRRAAMRILSDMNALAQLEAAMQDSSTEIRKAAATIFADKMYLPGLALALSDESSEVSAIATTVLEVDPESTGPYLRAIGFLEKGLKNENTRSFATEQLQQLSGLRLGEDETVWQNWLRQTTRGLQPGAWMEYFTPTQKKPVTSGTFDTVDIGLKFQANFPKVWYDYWDKPQIFPEDAKGPFRLQITAQLYIPDDGNYRFYAKTVIPNAVKVFIETPTGLEEEIIAPSNEEKLQYVTQAGMPTHRIDFSTPIPLKKGMVKLKLVYTGEEVRNIRKGEYDHIAAISGIQKVGIQLFWSSDHHLTELVPATNLFHASHIAN